MKDIGAPESRRGLLEPLLDRRSVAALEEPAPSQEEVGLILDAGLRAPDHGRLRPWRFVLIRGAAREAFGDCLVAAAKRRDANVPPALLDRYRTWPLRTPLLIAVGAAVRPAHVIPEIEQILSAGAAAMNMLNAVHLLGYGGMWVTGANTYDRGVNAALGFEWPSRIVGFLMIGTPKNAAIPERPSRTQHAVDWAAPVRGAATMPPPRAAGAQ
ncbi:MAG: nitroreductase [Proteobacteria bacterium]|nr:nitroreductase [Pseudomonadota bacterium]